MSNKYPNSKEGAKELANFLISQYEQKGIENLKIDNSISTIFLSGAPGAGKTEFFTNSLNFGMFYGYGHR